MKNFTIGLNIALVIAVAVLFYLHFSSKKQMQSSAIAGNNTGSGNFKIAYIETDSIENQFELLKNVRSSLNSRDQELSGQLSQLENNFAKKYQDYQKNGPSLSQAEAANRQQELVELDKNLKNKKQMIESELQDESFKKLQDIKKKIGDYLKIYNKNRGYSYIFASSPDMMYYKDTIYNITPDVVKGLNELYKNKK